MNDLKFALRQLRKNPGFTAVAVLTLALGIGANTAIFSAIDGVLLRPLPFPGQDRLVTVWESSPAQGIDQQRTSPLTYKDWQSEDSYFEQMGFWTGPTDRNLVTAEGSERVRASFASSSLFHLLGVEPRLGRGFVQEDDLHEGPQTAVLSDELWQKQFGGDPGIVGRSLTLDSFGRRTFTIVGVMPARFRFPDETDLWLASGWNGLPQDRRGGHWIDVLARLKPKTTLEQARSEMNGIQSRLARVHPEARLGTRVSIVPLLQQTVGRRASMALQILWGAVAVVLLIACANVANLLLARGAARQKEIAVRLALGAGRGRVIRQLLAESILLSMLGGGLGVLLGILGLKVFVAANPVHVPRLAEVSVDGVALGYTLAIAGLTGVVFGLAPAWQFSRPNLNEALKEGGRGMSGGVPAGRTRNGLVVAEVALATLLLVGAGLMLQSFARLLATNRGINAEHVVSAELDFSVSGYTTWVAPTATRPQVKIHELLDRVRQLPGVQSAGVAYQFLRQDNRPPVNWPISIFGRPVTSENERPTAEHDAVSPGYFRALGIPLLRGRDFTEDDTLTAKGVAVVNESFVRRYFPNEDPIGQHLTQGSQPGPLDAVDRYGVSVWCEIVGVVGDVKSLSAQPEPVPEVYRSYWQWPMQSPQLFVRGTGDVSSLASAIRRETKTVAPSQPPPRIGLLSRRIRDSVAEPRFQAGLLGFFGALALFLAACGIYGVLAYAVAQRQREIGVRMALGARKGKILALVLGQGLKLALMGVALGTLMAWALTRVLRSTLYEITPTDPATFAGVVFLLVLTTVLACWLPACRASGVNPMEALRNE